MCKISITCWITLIVYKNIDSVQFCLSRYLNKNKCFVQHYWARITSCSGITKWFAFFPPASQASLQESQVFRAVNPPGLQIVGIDRAGMMNDVIIQLKAHNVICAKIPFDSHRHKTCEQDVVGIVTFDLNGLLPSDHIIILKWLTRVF